MVSFRQLEESGQLFHSALNDMQAFRAGEQAARQTSPVFRIEQIQRENAADFSKYFGDGFASELGSPAVPQHTPAASQGREARQEIHIHLDAPIEINDREIARVVNDTLVELTDQGRVIRR